jgi:hypothetical protein
MKNFLQEKLDYILKILDEENKKMNKIRRLLDRNLEKIEGVRLNIDDGKSFLEEKEKNFENDLHELQSQGRDNSFVHQTRSVSHSISELNSIDLPAKLSASNLPRVEEVEKHKEISPNFKKFKNNNKIMTEFSNETSKRPEKINEIEEKQPQIQEFIPFNFEKPYNNKKILNLQSVQENEFADDLDNSPLNFNIDKGDKNHKFEFSNNVRLMQNKLSQSLSRIRMDLNEDDKKNETVYESFEISRFQAENKNISKVMDDIISDLDNEDEESKDDNDLWIDKQVKFCILINTQK